MSAWYTYTVSTGGRSISFPLANEVIYIQKLIRPKVANLDESLLCLSLPSRSSFPARGLSPLNILKDRDTQVYELSSGRDAWNSKGRRRTKISQSDICRFAESFKLRADELASKKWQRKKLIEKNILMRKRLRNVSLLSPLFPTRQKRIPVLLSWYIIHEAWGNLICRIQASTIKVN